MLFGYIRVSSLEQALDDRTSLDTQRRVINGIAMARGVGQFDLQIFCDPGVSASIPLKDRPEGSKLWDAAKEGDVIVVSKLDRIFRDALDAQTSYKEFKRRKVDLICYDMGVDPITRDGMSKFFFTMLSAFADLERNRINERMQEGKRAKKEKGGHVGGEAPYGYRIVGEGREARLEVDPTDQEVIQIVFENRHLRRGINRILASKGYTSRTGKRFQAVQIDRMLYKDLRAN